MRFNKIKNILKNNNCNFIHLNSTTSTMEDAKQYLEKFDSNVAILAEEQTKGRGRRGNKWISNSGNIYCSVALKNTISLKDFFSFSILTAVSIKITIEQLGVSEVMFKWPNDMLYKNKKFGGIIVEHYKSPSNMKYAIIGIGINFSSAPFVNNYQTTYIESFINIDNRNVFLDSFFNNFFFYWHNYITQKKNIFLKFQSSLLFLNEKIKIYFNDRESIEGIFKGINNDGSLILNNNDKLISIYSGTISK